MFWMKRSFLLLWLVDFVYFGTLYGRTSKNKELLKQLLGNNEEDEYFGGEDHGSKEPYISADDIPKEGEMFEGDIIMDDDLRSAVIGADKRSALADATLGKRKHWTNGVVPYVLDGSLKPKIRTRIEEAIKEFHNCTCVQFVPRKKEKDHIVFSNGKGSGCSSNVGRKGGAQEIHLAGGCSRIGTVMHEMMHALGIIHEQSRSDRDQYIKINYKNIKKAYWHNFKSFKFGETRNLEIPYNFNSVMHYGNYAFSKDGDSPTIESKINPEYKFGQRRQLAHSDLLQISKLYPCKHKQNKCSGKESGVEIVKDMIASEQKRKAK